MRVDLLTRRGTAHDDVIHAVDAWDFTADLEAGVMSPERWSVNLASCLQNATVS
jgi:hypothetical protein